MSEIVNEMLEIIKSDNSAALDEKIKGGVDINIQFPPELDTEPEFLRNGAPLLCFACYYGKMNCIKYLLENKCNIEEEDDEGLSCQHYAIAGGQEEALFYLQQHGVDLTGCATLALRYSQENLFKMLLNRGLAQLTDVDFTGNTFLHIAAFNGLKDTVEFIVSQNKIDVNTTDKEGRTALHLAAGNGHLEIVQYLLQQPNIREDAHDNYEKSPIYYAAVQQEYKIVELFLKGPINEVGRDGKTPLMRAARWGKAALCKLILEMPLTNPNVQNAKGKTALHYACKGGQTYCAKLLLDDDRIDPNIQNERGQTPLHVASQNNEMKIIQLLLSRIDINILIKDKNGKTPIDAVDEQIQQDPVKKG